MTNEEIAARGRWRMSEGLELWMARAPDGRLRVHFCGNDPDAVKRSVAFVHDSYNGTRAPYDGRSGRWEACEMDGWRVERVAIQPLPPPPGQPQGGAGDAG